jgi:hypothetical protein
VRSIVAVFAILFVQAWILSDVLNVDGWLRRECGTYIGTACGKGATRRGNEE